ncbi:Proline-rich receptor protein kinase PERK5 [Spatholobus suberectus]|nr:Proline-rich receptor protein kinase PERK5 [Spatholobus suberectus]
MSSNSDTNSPTPPPPDSSSSQSPPPPSQGNSSSPPPPSQDNSSPPPSSPPPSSPPPQSSSSPPPPSPPPPENDKNSPPPPSDSSPSPPPPPPDKESGSHRPPPPPPPRSPSSHGFSPPPPPPQRLSPAKSSSNSDSSGASGDSGSPSSSTPLIIGVAAGVGILLLLLIVVFACSRRKKKSQPSVHYFANQPGDDGHYKRAAAGPNQYNGEHVLNIPPPPGAGWGAATQAASQRVSSDMSNSSFSGPHGPVLPPPHPTVALGFNQSSFTYDELSAATGGFAQRNLVGQGGFGYVHKGVLPNGKEIAVKSLKSTGGKGDREFQAEADVISRVHHRHLVSLVGYCISESKKLLVYEFVPNKTLEFHLHGKGRPVMDWDTRIKIAIGSAKGLAYLHEDCHPRIIHRDIKGANILLENNFEAKVADFGLAKFSQDTNTHVSTRVMGTFGYLAPEYASSGKLTDKSDVFSFGIMLLELVTGRRPVASTGQYEDNLVDWARPLCTKAMENETFDGLVDPRLEDNYDKQQMACMVGCAAASVRHSSRKRPRMSQIVRVLEGDVSVDVLNHEGVNGQSALYSSASGEYGAVSYGADMMKFRKLALDSGKGSTEFGASGTSEYGLNLSISSSEQSTTEHGRRTEGRMHTP